MRKGYEDIVGQAEAMVCLLNKFYRKGNKLAYVPLLEGKLGYTYQAIVDAIHNVKDSEMGYHDGLYAMCRMPADLKILLDILFYQLKKEKEGTASFTVDVNGVVERINLLLQNNWEMFESLMWFDRYRFFAYKEYGIELWSV